MIIIIKKELGWREESIGKASTELYEGLFKITSYVCTYIWSMYCRNHD